MTVLNAVVREYRGPQVGGWDGADFFGTVVLVFVKAGEVMPPH